MNMSNGLCILALCLGYVMSSADFDCRRIVQSCVTGTCDDLATAAGACTCPKDASSTPTHTGKDCGLEVATVAANQESCSPTCMNGGTCYDSGSGVFKCYCVETHYGDQCETPKKMVKCTGDSMTIEYTPPTAFTGKIFIVDKETTTGCAFTKDGDKYVVTFPLVGDCNVQKHADTPNTGDETYKNQAVIQFSPDLESPTDLSLKAQCVIEGSGISNMTQATGDISVDQRANLTEETAVTNYQPVSFNLQTKTGGSIPTQVFIGDELRMFIPLADTGTSSSVEEPVPVPQLSPHPSPFGGPIAPFAPFAPIVTTTIENKPTRRYTKLKIISLKAGNAMEGADMVEVELINAGCLTSTGESVIVGKVELDASVPSLIVNFLVFRVRGSGKVKFDVEVKVCEATDTACEDSVCTGVSTRRKRAAGDGDVILHSTLTVLDPLDQALLLPEASESARTDSPKPSNSAADPEKCLQSKEILVMVVVLVIAVLVLLVITTCIAVKFLKQRAQVKYMDSPHMTNTEHPAKMTRPMF